MSLLVYHFYHSQFYRPCRFISPIGPPFNGPTGFTILGRRTYRFYNATKEPAGYTILPFLSYLAPSAGLRCRLSHLPTGLLVCHFYHFAYFYRSCGFISPISPLPNDHTGFTIFGFRTYRIYTVNKRTYRIRRCTIFAYVSAPFRCATPISSSPSGPLVYHFSNFSARAGLYRQLVRHLMALLVLPFPASAPTKFTP